MDKKLVLTDGSEDDEGLTVGWTQKGWQRHKGATQLWVANPEPKACPAAMEVCGPEQWANQGR